MLNTAASEPRARRIYFSSAAAGRHNWASRLVVDRNTAGDRSTASCATPTCSIEDLLMTKLNVALLATTALTVGALIGPAAAASA
ncbi:MAG: hypothetical protein ACOY6K_11055, partial [Pseudomonadota bacterium]